MFCPTGNDQARQLYNYAMVLEKIGKLEEAKQSYLKAIELDAGFCDAMDNLGLLLRGQGNIDESIYWYKKSIEIFPNNPVAHQNLAFAYQVKGQVTEAISEYQLLIRIDPDNPGGYYGLGNVYLRLDQPLKAIKQHRKAEKLYARQSSPSLTDAQYALGVSYRMLEKYEKAKDYFELVYPEMSDIPDLNYFLGLYYLQEDENLELAEKYLKKAKELGMDIPQYIQKRLVK